MGASVIDIFVLVVGSIRTNCYVVVNPSCKEAVIIDPGDMPDRIIRKISELDVNLKAILITHGHYDHIGAVSKLKDYYGAKVYAGNFESELLSDSALNASRMFGINCNIEPEVLLKDNDFLKVCGLDFSIIHTPGHTSGGVCYYLPEDNVLFSGDTLFYETIGRSDLPTGDGRALIKSIKDKLFLLPDETKVFPGHGDSTTIGHEKMNNPYVTE